MPDDDEPDLRRFGEAVRNRRVQLGLSQEQVAARGGPSDTTLTKVENAEWVATRPSETLRKLDKGLAWIEGSAADVYYRGGTPSIEQSDHREWHIFDPDNLPPGTTLDTPWPLPLSLGTLHNLLLIGGKAKRLADVADANGVDALGLIEATRETFKIITTAAVEVYGGIEPLSRAATAIQEALTAAQDYIDRKNSIEDQSQAQAQAATEAARTVGDSGASTTPAGGTGYYAEKSKPGGDVDPHGQR